MAIGRSAGRSTPSTDILWSRLAIGTSAGTSTPQMHHGIYIMGFIWLPFCILQEKVGISFHFWIIRAVNSQLALFSHVRCNLSWHPWHPQNTPQMTFTNFNYEGSYLPGIICNIVIKADHGISASRSTPQYWHLVVQNDNFTLLLTSSGQEWQLADLSPWYWHLVVQNGNFTLLLISSGQEWQFHIATDI